MTAMAEYQRIRRDAARSRGDCTTCCCKPKLAKKTRCESCDVRHRAAQNAYTARLREGQVIKSAWCVECSAAGFHREGCRP